MSKFILYLVLGFHLARPSIQSVTSLTQFTFYTSCNDPTDPLPNLQFAKRNTATFTTDIPCSGHQTSPSDQTITWYYYASLPQAGHCVAHDTLTLTINFTTTTIEQVGANTVGTRKGTVIAGAFLGQNATYVLTTTATTLPACESDIGVEEKSGTVALRIENPGLCGLSPLPSCGGTPVCTGVIVLEFCPGLTGNYLG